MTHNTPPFINGASHIHSYFNEPPLTAKNVCGQAAVAAMLDVHQVDRLALEKTEYDSVDGQLHWPNAKAINAVWTRHRPDCLRGLAGTSPGRIVDALRYWGLSAQCLQPDGTLGKRELWQQVEGRVNDGLPVITIVNRSKLVPRHDPNKFINRIRNRLPMAHWAIVYKVDDLHVHVANARQADRQKSIRVSKDHYRRAMDEWWMDLFGFRHCTIFVAPEDESGER